MQLKNKPWSTEDFISGVTIKRETIFLFIICQWLLSNIKCVQCTYKWKFTIWNLIESNQKNIKI